jgi:hypothetical protein
VTFTPNNNCTLRTLPALLASSSDFVFFNIRHNSYRLMVAAHYAKMIEGRLTLGHVCIAPFMTRK